ncbi:MAG: diguanylate cyclase domain-containing protein [Lachnospira eligens]
MFNDRTEAVELLEYEKFRATHDNLTGLLNKEQFYEETANVVRNDRITNIAWCAVILKILSLLMSFWNRKGDEIIKMQAGLIKASSESGYICGRIQNDRFAVCMPKDSFKNEIMQNSIVSMQDRFNNASFR